jgi:Ca2+/H+ antiporter, TMEM165/GDT1 family
MRLTRSRRGGISPLLLFLAFSSASIILDERAKPDSVQHLIDKVGKAYGLDAISNTAPASKRESGTKDAPVDGLDGKPHAGPFVDSLDSSKKPTQHIEDLGSSGSAGSKGTFKDTFDTPIDDGVMSKDKGSGPIKGPTGTEGGVSQKDKDRKEGKAPTEKKPEQPKEASQPAGGKSSTLSVDREKDGEKKKGAAGLEVRLLTPANLHLIDT